MNVKNASVRSYTDPFEPIYFIALLGSDAEPTQGYDTFAAAALPAVSSYFPVTFGISASARRKRYN